MVKGLTNAGHNLAYQAPAQDEDQFFSFDNSDVMYCELMRVDGGKPAAKAEEKEDEEDA